MRLSILGCTGSIGQSTLDVVRHLNNNDQIVAMAAHSNIEKLAPLIEEFKPKLVAVYDSEKAIDLQKLYPKLKVVSGIEGVCEAASYDEADFIVSAMSGTLGLKPTVAAIKAGKRIGLANKETLVTAGEIVMPLAEKYGATLLPIDSEHSAIFQCLEGEERAKIRRIIITASGGPFRNATDEELKSITKEKALAHPTWQMGPKITIDSSTLMNKGLEVIEAKWLFGVGPEKIEVVVHPQSIIHSMVEFTDGSILAQMSEPTMKLPIQHVLTYPQRKQGLLKPFDFTKSRRLDFEPVDFKKFKALRLAFEALEIGGTMTAYMNGANEVLVSRFLDGEISWLEISDKLEKLMATYGSVPLESIDHASEVDKVARREARII